MNREAGCLRGTSLLFSILIFVSVLCLSGCAKSSPDEDGISGEEIADASTAINAVGFDEAADITLFQKKTEGYIAVENGDYVLEGLNTSKIELGVKVEGGPSGARRVFVGDGSSVKVEATLDGQYYICEFSLDTEYVLAPVLIEVVYDDERASKEKFVLRTKSGSLSDEIIPEGIGVLIGKNVLSGAAGLKVMKNTGDDGVTSAIRIDALTPTDATARESDTVAMNVSLSLITYPEFDPLDISKLLGLIYMPFGITDGLDGATTDIAPTTELTMYAYNIFGKLYPFYTVSNPLMYLSLEEKVYNMASLFGFTQENLAGLELETKPVFFMANSLSEDSSDEVVALTVGPLVAKTEAGDTPEFPDGINIYNGTHPGLSLNSSSMQTNEIGLSMCQDTLTQLITALFEGDIMLGVSNLVDLVPTLDVSGMTGNVKTRLYVNTQGIAFDFRGGNALFTIDDLRMEYLVDGVAQWQISMDMTFQIWAGTTSNGVNGVYFNLIPDLSRCHVLKDDIGIGIIDHSTFVDTLVDLLAVKWPGLGQADLMVPVDTIFSSLGLPLTGISSSTDSGRCFLKLATESDAVDLTKAGFSCFISTAGY